MTLIGALALVGTFSTSAFAEPGNTEISNIFPQGGISFDVLDPDGIKSVEWIDPGSELIVVNANCDDPQITQRTFAPGSFSDNPGPNTFLIIDCQPEMSETTCTFTSGGTNQENEASVECTFETLVVGGVLFAIDNTALILAGAQSFSFMIPLLLSGIGIGLFVVSRKSENS